MKSLSGKVVSFKGGLTSIS